MMHTVRWTDARHRTHTHTYATWNEAQRVCEALIATGHRRVSVTASKGA